MPCHAIGKRSFSMANTADVRFGTSEHGDPKSDEPSASRTTDINTRHERERHCSSSSTCEQHGPIYGYPNRQQATMATRNSKRKHGAFVSKQTTPYRRRDRGLQLRKNMQLAGLTKVHGVGTSHWPEPSTMLAHQPTDWVACGRLGSGRTM